MIYLELVIIGYLVNAAIYVVSLFTIFLISIGRMFIWGDSLQVMEEAKVMTSLGEHFKEIKEDVPSNVHRKPIEYAIFFPFMLCFTFIIMAWNMLRYGINGYLITEMAKKIDKIEIYKKDNKI